MIEDGTYNAINISFGLTHDNENFIPNEPVGHILRTRSDMLIGTRAQFLESSSRPLIYLLIVYVYLDELNILVVRYC